MSKSAAGQKIRLLFLVGELGLGGSERQLHLLLKNMDAALFSCHVVVFNPTGDGVLHDALRKAGVEVWEIPESCRSIMARIRYLFSLFRQIHPDIIQSWTVHDNVYAGLIGRLVSGRRCMGVLRGSTQLRGFKELPELYQFLALHSVSQLIVNAESIARELRERGYPEHKIVVIPNCVEVPPLHLPKPDLSTSGIHDQPLIGAVGNLRGVKNHPMFVNVMASVIAQYPEVRGMIVGQSLPSEPEVAPQLRALISERALEDKVQLIGFRSDIPALMQRFSVLCLTSTSEGLPNVILEAMAAACPVIATRVGGVPELVIDGVTGFLVDSGDVEGMSIALKDLLSNPEKAYRMGQAGRLHIQHTFSCSRATQQLAALYLSMISRKQPPSASVIPEILEA